MAPSPDPSPSGEGDTRPLPHRRLRRLDPRAYGARHSPNLQHKSPPLNDDDDDDDGQKRVSGAL